jgi:enoyl-CoA hydratase/carnithine racemase
MARNCVNWSAADGVATITLDRAPLNLLCRALHAELAVCLDEVIAAESVRVVIFTGAGERAFCAGSDLNEFQEDMRPGGGRERVLREHAVMNKIDALGKPTLAAINGLAFGGGLELALACDIRIADAGARLALPEIKLGVFPGAGGTERLPRLVGEAKAKEMMYLGEPVSAEEALRIGLVNQVAPHGQALEVATEMARQIASRSGAVLALLKQVIDQGLETPSISDARFHVAEALDRAFQTEDIREGVQAFFERRPAQFKHR